MIITDVIVGGMFSGKTEETLRRLKRAKFAKKKILLALASIDDRPNRNIGTMAKEENWLGNYKHLHMGKVDSFSDLKILTERYDPDILVIDEVHLFKEWIVDFIKDIRFLERYKNKNMRIIVSGLDMDYMGKPYETTGLIMAMASDVQKLTAICKKCEDKPAMMTWKKPSAIQKNPDRIDVGESQYQPRCWECYLLEEE